MLPFQRTLVGLARRCPARRPPTVGGLERLGPNNPALACEWGVPLACIWAVREDWIENLGDSRELVIELGLADLLELLLAAPRGPFRLC